MEESLARALFAAGVSHCSITIQAHGGALGALLMAGFLGSWTHCSGMCGPFVLSQVSARLECIPAVRLGEHHRWLGALLVPYHLGRMITYGGLGAVAATVTAGAERLPGVRGLGAGLLALAALGFLLAALERLAGLALLPGLPASGCWGRLAGRVVRPLLSAPGAPVGWRGLRLGLGLGFIPCGMVYGALAVAAATGAPLAGAFCMLAFALGTLPALVAIGLAGHAAGRELPLVAGQILPALMILNAAWLAWLAWRTMGA